MALRTPWKRYRPLRRDTGGESAEAPINPDDYLLFYAAMKIEDRSENAVLTVYAVEDVRENDIIAPVTDERYRVKRSLAVPGSHERELLIEKIER